MIYRIEVSIIETQQSYAQLKSEIINMKLPIYLIKPLEKERLFILHF
jgi:hypothetical protein